MRYTRRGSYRDYFVFYLLSTGVLQIQRSIYVEQGGECHVTAPPIQERAITQSALTDDGSNQPWEISSKERVEKPVVVE